VKLLNGFPKQLRHFTSPHLELHEAPNSLHPHQDFSLSTFPMTVHLSHDSHPSGCSTVAFICISLVTKDVEHLFTCLLATYISSLEKYLFHSFAHFLNHIVFLMSCKSSLYILDTRPLLDIWFPNISFHSGLFFHCLIMLFEVQMFLIMMKPNLSFFFSYALCLRNLCLCLPWYNKIFSGVFFY